VAPLVAHVYTLKNELEGLLFFIISAVVMSRWFQVGAQNKDGIESSVLL